MVEGDMREKYCRRKMIAWRKTKGKKDRKREKGVGNEGGRKGMG